MADPREIVKKCAEFDKTKNPATIEECLVFFRKMLLLHELSESNMKRILTCLVNSPYRDDYTSIIRDVSHCYVTGKMTHETFSRIILSRDSRGFLVPEISLINCIVSVYSVGRFKDAENMIVKIIQSISLDNAKELALILFFTTLNQYLDEYLPTVEKYCKKENTSSIIYDYSSNFITNRPRRTRFFSEPFYAQSVSEVNNAIFPIVLERLTQLGDIRLQILVIATIFERCSLDLSKYVKIMESIAESSSDENVKADCYDCLARFFPDGNYAQKIKDLGTEGKRTANFYQNSQNAHLELDDAILTYLDSIEKVGGIEEEMERWLDKNVNSVQKVALDRIRRENTLFQKKYTLYDVLVLCWGKIKHSEHEEELKRRLLEELDDMSNTCFTGHITRLVNIFSGYEDTCIRISWFDQVKSNFTTQIQRYISENPDKRDALIEELEENSVKNLLPDLLVEIAGLLEKDFVGQGYIGLEEYNSYIDTIFTDYGL